jgi:hypothetical protein
MSKQLTQAQKDARNAKRRDARAAAKLAKQTQASQAPKLGAPQDTAKQAPKRDKFGARLDSHQALINAALSSTEARTMKQILAIARTLETAQVRLLHATYYDHLNRLVAAKKVRRNDDGAKRTYVAII